MALFDFDRKLLKILTLDFLTPKSNLEESICYIPAKIADPGKIWFTLEKIFCATRIHVPAFLNDPYDFRSFSRVGNIGLTRYCIFR